MDTFIKTPSAKADYKWDWSDWLPAGDTIQSAVVTVSPTGLTIGVTSIISPNVTVWLEGGTAGTAYTVTCTITTNAGRIEARSVPLQVIATKKP